MTLRRPLLALLLAAALGLSGCDTYGVDPPDPDPPVEPGDPAEVLGCASRGDLALGGITEGTLADSDCTLDAGRYTNYTGGEYVDAFVLSVASATALRLDLESTASDSTAFDAYLIVTDDEGDAIASNDDVVPGGADTDSRVEITLAVGTYFVLATSFFPGETGPYALTVTPN